MSRIVVVRLVARIFEKLCIFSDKQPVVVWADDGTVRMHCEQIVANRHTRYMTGCYEKFCKPHGNWSIGWAAGRVAPASITNVSVECKGGFWMNVVANVDT